MPTSAGQRGLTGERHVGTYKLYHIQGGHFVRSESFEAQDDEEAKRAAQDRIGEDPAELWFADRKVAMFKPGSDPTDA